MKNIKIEATERSPEIAFDFTNNQFSIVGESYPENISVLYGEIIETLEEHFKQLQESTVTFNFELIYFNSSSARVFMELFEMLDKTAINNEVVINWYFEEDDDTMEEIGEEFGEDLEQAKFHLVSRP